MATGNFPQGPFLDERTGYPTLEWVEWLQNPELSSIIIVGTIDVPSGGTGLSSGTSGGILGFTSSTTMASSVALTDGAIVLGGGPGATPTPLNSLGTTTTVLHGNASGNPTWGAVDLTSDVDDVLPIANGGTNSSAALSGATIMVAQGGAIVQGNVGAINTVLHGFGSGVIPDFGKVVEDDQELDDVTTWDVDDTRHGYVPKAPGDPEMFLNGEGEWSSPGGSGGYWTILTNGDPMSPEIMFDSNGDVISFFVPT